MPGDTSRAADFGAGLDASARGSRRFLCSFSVPRQRVLPWISTCKAAEHSCSRQLAPRGLTESHSRNLAVKNVESWIDLARRAPTCSAPSNHAERLTSASIRVSADARVGRARSFRLTHARAVLAKHGVGVSPVAKRIRAAPTPRQRRRAPPLFAARRFRAARATAATCSRGGARSAPGLARPCGLRFDQSLRDLLSVQPGHHAIEQTLPHADEGVALANSHVGRITLADPGRAERLV